MAGGRQQLQRYAPKCETGVEAATHPAEQQSERQEPKQPPTQLQASSLMAVSRQNSGSLGATGRPATLRGTSASVHAKSVRGCTGKAFRLVTTDMRGHRSSAGAVQRAMHLSSSSSPRTPSPSPPPPAARLCPPCSHTWSSRSERWGSEGSTERTLKMTKAVSTICKSSQKVVH